MPAHLCKIPEHGQQGFVQLECDEVMVSTPQSLLAVDLYDGPDIVSIWAAGRRQTEQAALQAAEQVATNCCQL
jgi:hypothetical protein